MLESIYATVQSAINLGNSLTGQIIGTPFIQYRPVPGGAISGATQLATLSATFAQKGNFNAPGNVKSDEEYGYFDGSQTLPGDYLVGSSTYFIASQDPLLPYLCVQCPRIVTVIRPAQIDSAGVSGYGGNTAATETPILTGFPASILQGTKGERTEDPVPDDVKAPWYILRLPACGGVIIKSGDIVTDDLARRYTISSNELTEYGWRLTIRQNLN